jgi:FAD/FMN-containing dehydrogenase
VDHALSRVLQAAALSAEIRKRTTMSNEAAAAQRASILPIEELRSVLRGPVIGPADPDYEAARRVHNGMIDRRPAVIARCTGAADVMAALRFGRVRELPIAVRGGGHNVAGKAVCDDGIVIDLSAMKGIRVDPASRSVRAEAGLTWGEFDRETQAFGLATTGGAISSTGIAGLTLGGGIGWLQRKHGLTCDNLLSADVVTADGRFLTASQTEHPDLFWGLRGGGGNFGIVTSFEYRLHPLGPILAGPVVYPLSAAKDVCRFFRDFMQDAPDEISGAFALGPLPDGGRAAVLFLVYAGAPDEGEKVVAPVREFGSPLEDLLAPMSYCDVQRLYDEDFPFGVRNYWKSSNVATLSDDAIDTMVAYMESAPSLRPMVFVERLGGAIALVPADATAFGHRDAEYDLVIASIWSEDAEQEAHIEWARSFWEAMQPHATESVYVNYLGEEGEDRVRAAYGDAHYARLAELKRKYDPENILRSNQNIQPTPA